MKNPMKLSVMAVALMFLGLSARADDFAALEAAKALAGVPFGEASLGSGSRSGAVPSIHAGALGAFKRQQASTSMPSPQFRAFAAAPPAPAKRAQALDQGWTKRHPRWTTVGVTVGKAALSAGVSLAIGHVGLLMGSAPAN